MGTISQEGSMIEGIKGRLERFTNWEIEGKAVVFVAFVIGAFVIGAVLF